MRSLAAFAPRIAAKHPIYIYIIRRKRRAQKTAFFLHALHPEERRIFYGPCRTSKKRSTPTKTSFATQTETGHSTILNGRKRLIFIKCTANLNIHIKHSASAPPAQLLFFPNPRTAAMRCTIHNRRKSRIFTEFTANRKYPPSSPCIQQEETPPHIPSTFLSPSSLPVRTCRGDFPAFHPTQKNGPARSRFSRVLIRRSAPEKTPLFFVIHAKPRFDVRPHHTVRHSQMRRMIFVALIRL